MPSSAKVLLAAVFLGLFNAGIVGLSDSSAPRWALTSVSLITISIVIWSERPWRG